MRTGLITKKVWLKLLLATLVVMALLTSLVFIQKKVIDNQVDNTAASKPYVTKTFWYSPHRVAIWVYSPSMHTPIQVQLLLARQWFEKPELKFPQLYLLDGMRARDDQSGWLMYTNVEDFYKRKNINVVLPIGGESSFYTDWMKSDNGKHYAWETFLTKELPPILSEQWRSTEKRGVLGLSMGGTAAMMLTTRKPEMFDFAGSLSGFLQTSSMGMPAAIRYATYEAGHYDAYKMFGPPTDTEWKDHDPYLHTDKLRGKGIYLSAGTGTAGPFDKKLGISELSENYVGAGLEVLSRLSTQNFAEKLVKEKIPMVANFEKTGTHNWPYWQREAVNSWPTVAKYLKVSAAPKCGLKPAMLAYAKAKQNTGDCLTNSYPVAGGRAQDFTNGILFWNAKTHKVTKVTGAIAGTYIGLGGTKGLLGMPLGEEAPTPDNKARFETFQKGMIYWTPKTGANPVTGAILKKWGAAGFEKSKAGLPVSPEQNLPNGKGIVQAFENGLYYWSKDTGANFVTGKILDKYKSIKYENSFLGLPTSDEINLRDAGVVSKFQGGNIYWFPLRGAFAVANGPMMDAWGKAGFENGKYGYPVSDAVVLPGGKLLEQNFEKGKITVAIDQHKDEHKTDKHKTSK